MQIYNARYADNNQRFIMACIASFISAIVLGILFGWVKSMLMIIPSVLFIVIGYGIAWVIRKIGRGVTQKFMILGAVMTFLSILVADTCSIVGVGAFLSSIFNPQMWSFALQAWFSTYLSANLNSILGLILRGIGIYCGYIYSVIL